MATSTAKLGTQIIGATNNKNVIVTKITASTNTDNLIPGALYIIDDTAGSITLTVNTAPVGSEFHFFVDVLTNGVTFSAGTAGLRAPNDLTTVNKVYTHITLKYHESGRGFLIPSDPLI